MAKEHSLIFLLGSKIASSFNTDIAKVSKGIVGINTNLSKLDKTQKDIAKMATLGKSLREDKAKAIQLQQEVQRLAKEIKNTTNPTKELTSSFEAKKRELTALNQRMDKTQESFYKYRDSLRDAGVDTKNLTEESKRLKAELKEQTEAQAKAIEAEAKRNKHIANLGKAKKTGEEFTKTGKEQLKTGAVQAGIITMGVKLAIDDESSFADVKKTTGLVGEEAEKFRMQLINATKEIPLMNDEIYNIASAAGQAGIKQKELVRFTGDAAVMAVAFDQTAKDSGSTLATWRTAFGMTQDQVVTLGDQVNYLANSVNASASDISEVVNRVGAIGKNAGLSVEQVGALGASLIAMGQSPETASTAIKNMTGALTKGYAVTKAQAGAYAMLGLDAEKVAKQMQMDGDGTMLMVLEKINKINPAEKGALISQLFGEEAKAGVSQLSGQLDLLRDNLKRVADEQQYGGSMMAEYENRSATTENSLIILAKTGQTVASNFAYAFLPSIRSGSKELVNIAQKVGALTAKYPDLTKKVGYTLAGLAAFNLTMGASKMLLGNVITQGAKVIGFFTAKTVAVTADTVATGANNVAENTLYVTKSKSILLTVRKTVATGLHTTAMIGQKIATMGVSAALWVWNTAGLKTLLITTKNIAVSIAHRTATLAMQGATMIMTGAQWALNAALTANPIGLVVVGVGLLVGGLVLAYKKSEVFRTGVHNLWTKMKNLWTSINSNPFGKLAIDILALMNPITAVISGLGKLKESWSWVKEKLGIGGGGTGGGGTPKPKKKFAKGGIVTSPTYAEVGEGGDTEVIVPINSKPRSKALWQKAGEMLGMKTEGQNVSITNTESNITAQGGGGKTIIIQEIKIIVEGSLDKINDTKAKAKQLAQDVKAELQNIDLDDRRLNLG